MVWRNLPLIAHVDHIPRFTGPNSKDLRIFLNCSAQIKTVLINFYELGSHINYIGGVTKRIYRKSDTDVIFL